MNSMSRRALLAAASLPLMQASPSLAQATKEALKATVGVGLVTEGSIPVALMQRDGLVAKAAAELKIGLDLEFLDFQVLLRMVQGIVAGQIQIGMLGSTPTIRMLATANPAIPVALAGGGVNFPLMVNPGSPIHTLQDLSGKTVLTVVGSDLHLVLLLMLRAEFGHDDVKKLGITIRNAQAITEVGRKQSGIDAIAGSEPFGHAAERTGELVALLRNNGATGAAWQGPEGKGEGFKVASFAKSMFAPEAYYPHRIWWTMRRDFIEQQPDAVTAFLVANARAVDAMAAASVDEVIAIGGAKWAGEKQDQEKFLARNLPRNRGWGWATEGDVRSLIRLSAVKTIYETELKPEDVKRLVLLAAPAARRAWEIVGRKPAAAVFTDAGAPDTRGLPLWDAERWSL